MRNVLVQEFESETKFKKNELEQIEKRMKDVEAIWKRLQKSWSGRKHMFLECYIHSHAYAKSNYLRLLTNILTDEQAFMTQPYCLKLIMILGARKRRSAIRIEQILATFMRAIRTGPL